MARMQAHAVLASGVALLLLSPAALADEAPEDAAPPDAPAPSVPADAGAPTPVETPELRAPDDPRRKTDVTPHPTEPPAPERRMFTVDPVADGGILLFSAGFGLLSSALLETGEIRPQQISPSFTSKQLLWIDRGAIWQNIDSNAHAYSNVALGAIGAYAVLDTVLDGVREGPTAALVDATLYLEAVTITLGATNLAKIAFRRPRPRAYIERADFIAAGGDYLSYENGVTDSALSFFSGHAAAAASISAAATYIAFQRSPGTARPWLTLAGGTALTSFVAFERVRSGAHFPTDVIVGALAGSAIGALVVHIHRADSASQRRIWIGGAPSPGGMTLSASGIF
jgi:membrane-associated phospholipid phosphatase